MALGGLLFSVIIAAFYDAETLGLFNRSYSYYLVLSQLSTCGIHMAVLKMVSDARDNIPEARNIFKSACFAVLVISVVLIMFSELIINIFPMPEQRRKAIMFIIPALAFFSINKVILNYINARSEMIVFAIFQSLRNIFICLGIIILISIKTAGVYLTSAFFLGEGTLLLIMSFYLFGKKDFSGKISLFHLKALLPFGVKILPSNIVLEVNTKVDLLCLGWFISDEAIIGVYSLVTLFTEGFYQVYMVMRRMINPKLSLWIKDKTNWEEKYKYIRKICVYSAVPLDFLIISAFYLMILFLGKPIYNQGLVPLIIVASSIALNGLFIIYGNSMSQLGCPGKESIVNIITVGCNFLLNIVFIIHWGIIGAAVATALSYCCFSIFIHNFIAKGLVRCRHLFI